MQVEAFPLSPPSLEELAERLSSPLAANFEQTSVSVVQCPDLRKAPFSLASEGLSGDEKIADVGGRSNLFPYPRFETTWNLLDLARAMNMSEDKGSLIGAGAGPFEEVGQNCELAANIRWQDGMGKIDDQTHVAQIHKTTGSPCVVKSPSVGCALMINLYGSLGEPGNVLKIMARLRKGDERSFTECIRKGLQAAYGDSRTISLGGVFVIKSGLTRWHIMPDFPAQENLPFKGREQFNEWLTYHDFSGPFVCLSVLHSADPGNSMDLRLEHTHGYSTEGANSGGHYHYDIEKHPEVVEYEGYFNTAKVIYRIERPAEN